MYVEARAALARANRERRVSASQLRRAVQALEQLSDEIIYLDVDAQIADTAADLAERFELRGYDAVHLASAVIASAADLIVVTADLTLRASAEKCGLVVANFD